MDSDKYLKRVYSSFRHKFLFTQSLFMVFNYRIDETLLAWARCSKVTFLDDKPAF